MTRSRFARIAVSWLIEPKHFGVGEVFTMAVLK